MKKTNKMYTKKIFARSLAMKLVEYGADLVDVVPNKQNKDYLMYIFAVNENLDKAFDKHYGRKVS